MISAGFSLYQWQVAFWGYATEGFDDVGQSAAHASLAVCRHEVLHWSMPWPLLDSRNIVGKIAVALAGLLDGACYSCAAQAGNTLFRMISGAK